MQGFNWESHKYNWWNNLEVKVPDIAKAGFTSVWLPPPTQSFSPEGYITLEELGIKLNGPKSFVFFFNSQEDNVQIFSVFTSCAGYTPQNLYSLSSKYGSERQLKALLQKMKQYKVRAMADIVINHRTGTTQGRGGTYNRFDGIPLPWDERAVTSDTGGLVTSFTSNIFLLILMGIMHTSSFCCIHALFISGQSKHGGHFRRISQYRPHSNFCEKGYHRMAPLAAP